MNQDKSIRIRNNLEINKVLYNDYDDEVAIGDYIIDRDGYSNYKVVDIYLTPVMEYDHKLKRSAETDKMKIMIEGALLENPDHRSNNTTYDIKQWKSYSYSFYRGDINKLRQQVLNEIVNDKAEESELVKSDSTNLAVVDKDLLRQQKSKSIEMKNIVIAKQSFLKGILNNKLQQMREVQSKFMTVISRINKVIYSLEIYLGVNEDIVQIQKGNNAPADATIFFRQKLLFMDSEMADPDNDGIDFKSIDKFEDWLLKENDYHKKPNYQVSIPEEKCVVAFRVRERSKTREGWHSFSKVQAEIWDRKTYIFIRNGTNIYSIWADINIYPRLFPQRDEFIKELDGFASSKTAREESILKYKLQILLMQGIIERTPVFQPLSKNINLFDPEIHNTDLIKFVYDDEISLTDGTIVYKDWKKKVNENIKEGSRVILSGVGERGYTVSEFVQDRLWKVYYANTFSVPPAPSPGIYTVYQDERVRYRKDESVFVYKIMYNPKDEVHNSWDWYRDDDHERKNRLSFLINSDDKFVVHWDGIKKQDIEMLEKMIWDRRNRKDYLYVMPTLIKIIELKRKEIENENHFIRLVYGMNKTIFDEHGINEDSAVNLIQEAVEWWKLRNKWKRSLDSNDSKALNMISKRIIVPSRLKKYKQDVR